MHSTTAKDAPATAEDETASHAEPRAASRDVDVGTVTRRRKGLGNGA